MVKTSEDYLVQLVWEHRNTHGKSVNQIIEDLKITEEDVVLSIFKNKGTLNEEESASYLKLISESINSERTGARLKSIRDSINKLEKDYENDLRVLREHFIINMRELRNLI